MRSGFISALSILVLGPGGAVKAESIFYSIGPDNTSAPTSFNAIPAGGPGPAQLFSLGGGVAFNGGLTYRSTDGRFYAIANDNSGNSTLESFTLGGPGTLTTAFGLGTGFLSGLAFDSADGNLYAVADDPGSGHSFLDRLNLGASTVTQVLDLGVGFEGGGLFTGGLTFDSLNGRLYLLGADIDGVSRSLYDITLLTNTATFQFNLGDGSLGFNGGLLFNPGNGLFYAISNDMSGASELNSFSLGGGAGSLTPLFSLGSGFNNVGLTETPAVPEPSTGLLFVTAVAGVAVLGRMRRLRIPPRLD